MTNEIPHTTKPEDKITVYKIALEMHTAGYPDILVSDIVEFSSEYEGAFNLMELWSQETDPIEREEIMSDFIEELNQTWLK